MISFKELNFEWPSKLDLNPAILECSHVKSLGIQLQFEDSRTWRSNMSEQRISIPFFMAFNVGHIGCLYLTLLANGVKWLHFDKQNKKIKTLKRNHAFHCLPACGTRIVQGGIQKKTSISLAAGERPLLKDSSFGQTRHREVTGGVKVDVIRQCWLI